MVSSDGKNSKQVETAVSKTNRAFGRMRKTFKFFNIKLFNILYPAFVRAHLEFASAVWNFMSEGVNRRHNCQIVREKSVNAPMRDNF